MSLRRSFSPLLGRHWRGYLAHPYRERRRFASRLSVFGVWDPGPSHLVEYELTMPDGKAERAAFPTSKPRIAAAVSHHRYFMLAEHLNGFLWPVAGAAGATRQ